MSNIQPLQVFQGESIAYWSQAGCLKDLATGGDLLKSAPPLLVLLHGIGSNARGWFEVMHYAASKGRPAMAWNMPGYCSDLLDPIQASAPIQLDRPDNGEAPWTHAYAERLCRLLKIYHGPIHLVGHSLGAIVAARAALTLGPQVRTLSLLSPAIGYSHQSASEQEALIQERFGKWASLGRDAYARSRAKAMMKSTQAEHIEQVEGMMQCLEATGYKDALHLLAHGNLLGDLNAWRHSNPIGKAGVAVGSEDAVTPPAQTHTAADALRVPLTSLGPLGHACLVEGSAQVWSFLQKVEG
jgi:pimeloyl-ACP methyl ester carboxylesterase